MIKDKLFLLINKIGYQLCGHFLTSISLPSTSGFARVPSNRRFIAAKDTNNVLIDLMIAEVNTRLSDLTFALRCTLSMS